MTTLTRMTLATLLALSVAGTAFAQFDSADAGRKFRGDYNSFHQSATYQRHAQDYSRMIYSSQVIQPAAPVAIVEKQAAAVKDNLAKSDEALKAVKEAHAKDPEVVKLVDSILKHHASTASHCNMVMACCKNGDGPGKIADCCADMHEDLEAAKKEMDALKKHLKIEELPVPKKQVSKK